MNFRPIFIVLGSALLVPAVALGQQSVNSHSVSYQPRDTRVVNIFAIPQDPVPSKPPADPFSDLPLPSQTSSGSNVDQETLPAAEKKQDADDLFSGQQALEDLPAPRQPSASQDPTNIELPPTNWINLGWVDEPSAPASQSQATRTTRALPAATYRRPSPPTPTINMMHPAIIQVPMTIRVVRSHVGYPYFAPVYPPRYYGYASPGYGSPGYGEPNYPDYYGPSTYGSEGRSGAGQQFDYSYHRATDQRLKYSRDPNLVGFPSHSVNYVGYPMNYLSYPANPHYGLHYQSFPVTRRLDR